MKKLPLLGAGLVALVFLAGLVHLFRLRFDAGDSFPPYSSFRADPLGTKALFESLDALRPAWRQLQPLARLGEGRDRTLFWLGTDPVELRFPTNEFRALDTFVRSGGRLVLALHPTFTPPRTNIFFRRAPVPAGAPTNAPVPVPWDDLETETLGERWSFRLERLELGRDTDGSLRPDTARLRDGLEASLPPAVKVRSAVGFRPGDPAWRVVYERGSGTNALGVVLERALGRGSVVLAADSYWFSNEAMRAEREPALLAWCAGPGREVGFEETHLGVQDHAGIASLARRYGLHTFFGAALVLVALFLWKNTTRFMPPHDEQMAGEEGAVIEGRDSAAGFLNLLRRHLPPNQVLRVCLEQWNTHVARVRPPGREGLEAVQRAIDAENALEPGRRNPVRTYRDIARALSRKSHLP